MPMRVGEEIQEVLRQRDDQLISRVWQEGV
jgi:hypothetical protein